MKKTNNKYRNNGNNNHSNQIYSLNYKFDSNSVAGKCSGTALDLIKRYNELARDANNNNDIVLAEIFRQYAEHYRKIVTDINDKKAIRINENRKEEITQAENKPVSEDVNVVSENNEQTAASVEEHTEEHTEKKKTLSPRKKEFKIIEIKETKKIAKRTIAEEEKETKSSPEKETKQVSDKKLTLRTGRTKKTEEETSAVI